MTCTAGNIEARQVADNTRALLELAGRTDVEVALGREVPLVRPLMIAPETHGPRGIGYAELPEPTRRSARATRADLIIEEARRRPGEITADHARATDEPRRRARCASQSCRVCCAAS